MSWNILEAIPRHFFAVVVTVVTLGIAVGLAFWIWSDRFTRRVPTETELVEIAGRVTRAMAQPNSGVVWLDLAEARRTEGGGAEIRAVRLHARDPRQLEAALSSAGGTAHVAAWVVREELEVATIQTPPSALQLRVGDNMVIPYSEGRSVREDHAAQARASAWVAGIGAVVALGVLVVFWIQRSRT